MTDAEFQAVFDAHKDAVYPARFDPGRGTQRAFLLGIARNLVLKRWRAEHRLVPLVPTSASTDVGELVGLAVNALGRFAINNEPERIVPAGSTFFEPIGALHSTNAAVPGAPARFVAFLVGPHRRPGGPARLTRGEGPRGS